MIFGQYFRNMHYDFFRYQHTKTGLAKYKAWQDF